MKIKVWLYFEVLSFNVNAMILYAYKALKKTHPFFMQIYLIHESVQNILKKALTPPVWFFLSENNLKTTISLHFVFILFENKL